jgi:hypothetical protein
MNYFDNLLHALELLDRKLEASAIQIDIIIVGSMAIYLNDYKIERFTEDIDFVGYNETNVFLDLVKEVSRDCELKDDWINSRADTVKPLPNFEQNLIELDRFTNINAKVINRETIIKMKVYAAYMRGQEKDIEDLILLKPNREEIVLGMAHIKMSIIENHNENQYLKFEKELYELL